MQQFTQFKVGDTVEVVKEAKELTGVKGIIEEIQVGYAMVITEPKHRDRIGAFFWVNLEKCKVVEINES